VKLQLCLFDPISNLQSPISEGAPLIVWNQRWEYDKDPEAFFRALYVLAEEALDFQVALAGRSYRQAARARLGVRVVLVGCADEGQYLFRLGGDGAALRRGDGSRRSI
jgi:hypothetical protein